MASSSNQATSWTYDVFLSFRGEDTRHNFTDHLYTDLIRKGLVTFRDDALKRGHAISPELMRAIEESRFSVVVLSKNYASSTWCLEELEKIMECMELIGQRILPVFYHVEPSEVRKQTGGFGEAFAAHEERFRDNISKVERWRNALKDVANLSGWTVRDSYESKCIEEIVGLILRELLFTGMTFPKELVGVDSRFSELSSYLNLESDDVQMIGICGMGGIGKTTIAHVLYDRLSHHFQDSSSFLENIKGTRMLDLQRQLLSETLKDKNIEVHNIHSGARAIANRLKHKRVFLVLDDVDDAEQLEMLAGRCEWFGLGSRIIITSRDEHLLSSHGARKIYRAQELNKEEALELFKSKVFKGGYGYPSDNSADYNELTTRAVNYANGLPLAVKVVGSFLCGRSINQWRDAMDRMEEFPDEKVSGILRLSYDGLLDIEKTIFLDIACFFRSKNTAWVTRILESCGFYPKIGISVLIEKSLVTVSGDRIEMHDLLQKMGREIVRRENPQEPGRRSRLWRCKDIHPVLTNNKGTERVEGIVLVSFSREEQVFDLDSEAFSKMERLRYLEIIHDIRFPQGLAYLSNELRYIEWHDFPLNSFPSTFDPKKLLELHLPYSKVNQLFHGAKSLEKLKIIDLSYSRELVRTPNLESLPNLEVLNLEGCRNLSEIIPLSILVHKRLITLDLRGCSNLQYLPNKICLQSLKLLNLCSSPKLKNFPEITNNMENLTTLSLHGTAIRQLPQSIRHLTGLELLDLQFCQNLVSLPSGICHLLSLRKLYLSGCSKLHHLPDNIGNLENLESLDLSGTSVTRLPSSMAHLKNLESLCLFRHDLRKIHNNQQSGFLKLILGRRSKSLLLPPWSGFCSLRKLELSFCNLNEASLSQYIGCLISLEELCLSGNDIGTLPEAIVDLAKLKVLVLNDCGKLVSLPKLPSSLICVEAENCTSLKKFPDPPLECSSEVVKLNFLHCFNIAKNRSHSRSLRSAMLIDYLCSHLQCHFEECCKEHAYEVTLPGDKLPRWFRHRSRGRSVRAEIEIPPEFHTSAIKGIVVVAAVFGSIETTEAATNKRRRRHKDVIFSSRCPPVQCKLLIDGGIFQETPFSRIGYDTRIGSNHLWLGCCFVDLKQCTYVEAVLGSEDWRDLEVKMCGIHPIIYGHDDIDEDVFLRGDESEGDDESAPEEPCKARDLSIHVVIPSFVGHWILGLFLGMLVLWMVRLLLVSVP